MWDLSTTTRVENGQKWAGNPSSRFRFYILPPKTGSGLEMSRSGVGVECTGVQKRINMGGKITETGENQELKPGSRSHFITF